MGKNKHSAYGVAPNTNDNDKKIYLINTYIKWKLLQNKTNQFMEMDIIICNISMIIQGDQKKLYPPFCLYWAQFSLDHYKILAAVGLIYGRTIPKVSMMWDKNSELGRC